MYQIYVLNLPLIFFMFQGIVQNIRYNIQNILSVPIILIFFLFNLTHR